MVEDPLEIWSFGIWKVMKTEGLIECLIIMMTIKGFFLMDLNGLLNISHAKHQNWKSYLEFKSSLIGF